MNERFAAIFTEEGDREPIPLDPYRPEVARDGARTIGRDLSDERSVGELDGRQEEGKRAARKECHPATSITTSRNLAQPFACSVAAIL